MSAEADPLLASSGTSLVASVTLSWAVNCYVGATHGFSTFAVGGCGTACTRVGAAADAGGKQCRCEGRSARDAADVVADTFLAAFRRRNVYDLTGRTHGHGAQRKSCGPRTSPDCDKIPALSQR